MQKIPNHPLCKRYLIIHFAILVFTSTIHSSLVASFHKKGRFADNYMEYFCIWEIYSNIIYVTVWELLKRERRDGSIWLYEKDKQINRQFGGLFLPLLMLMTNYGGDHYWFPIQIYIYIYDILLYLHTPLIYLSQGKLTSISYRYTVYSKHGAVGRSLWLKYRRSMGVSDPHKFSCGSGSRITKMSIWIRIQGGKH